MISAEIISCHTWFDLPVNFRFNGSNLLKWISATGYSQKTLGQYSAGAAYLGCYYLRRILKNNQSDVHCWSERIISPYQKMALVLCICDHCPRYWYMLLPHELPQGNFAILLQHLQDEHEFLIGYSVSNFIGEELYIVYYTWGRTHWARYRLQAFFLVSF